MPKKTVIWSPEARADLRAIDREIALRILRAIDTYLTTGAGDVKKLQPPRHEFRLRVGDYRVLFPPRGGTPHRPPGGSSPPANPPSKQGEGRSLSPPHPKPQSRANEVSR